MRLLSKVDSCLWDSTLEAETLSSFTLVEDAAARALAQHEGRLWLNGLTSLSERAAQALADHEGDLDLNGLTSLSDSPGHVALAVKAL